MAEWDVIVKVTSYYRIRCVDPTWLGAYNTAQREAVDLLDRSDDPMLESFDLIEREIEAEDSEWVGGEDPRDG